MDGPPLRGDAQAAREEVAPRGHTEPARAPGSSQGRRTRGEHEDLAFLLASRERSTDTGLTKQKLDVQDRDTENTNTWLTVASLLSQEMSCAVAWRRCSASGVTLETSQRHLKHSDNQLTQTQQEEMHGCRTVDQVQEPCSPPSPHAELP